MASALARIDAERQLIVAEDGLYVRDIADGRMTLFCPLEADNPATRSNDARVHPSGTFWIGTMGRKAEKGAGAIYALHRGKISPLFPGISIPNAICFSPDGAIGYFTDTARAVLYRVPLDPATGLPRGEPEVLLRHTRHRRSRRRGRRRRRADLERPLGRRAASMSTLRKASACARCACRRSSRAARPLSAAICRACWSPRPGRTWTRRRGPPIRSTAAPFCCRLGARPRGARRQARIGGSKPTHDQRSRRHEETV